MGRATFAGYDVIHVPFENGSPTGMFQPFLTGFIADLEAGTIYGRPVGLAELADGSMLVTDDTARIIWRVRYLGNNLNRA